MTTGITQLRSKANNDSRIICHIPLLHRMGVWNVSHLLRTIRLHMAQTSQLLIGNASSCESSKVEPGSISKAQKFKRSEGKKSSSLAFQKFKQYRTLVKQSQFEMQNTIHQSETVIQWINQQPKNTDHPNRMKMAPGFAWDQNKRKLEKWKIHQMESTQMCIVKTWSREVVYIFSNETSDFPRTRSF